jgi:hypothetical protein
LPAAGLDSAAFETSFEASDDALAASFEALSLSFWDFFCCFDDLSFFLPDSAEFGASETAETGVVSAVSALFSLARLFFFPPFLRVSC